jgi:hypothetical protein
VWVTLTAKVSAYLRTACAALVLLVPAALTPSTASAEDQCWQELVEDWSDGAISNLYPIRCYRQALRNMPEDVRLYSSASDDINRALTRRVVSRSVAGADTAAAPRPVAVAAVTGDDSSDVPFVLAGSLAALLAIGAGAGYLAHRKWRGAARLGTRHD